MKQNHLLTGIVVLLLALGAYWFYGSRINKPQSPVRQKTALPEAAPEFTVKTSEPFLRKGTKRGVKLTHIGKQFDYSTGKEVTDLTERVTSYYFEDGSFWIEVPIALVIYDEMKKFYLYYDKMTGEMKQTVPGSGMFDFKREKTSPDQTCTFGNKDLICQNWLETIVSRAGVTIRRKEKIVSFDQILNPTENFTKTVDSLITFFGRKSVEQHGLPHSANIFLVEKGMQKLIGSIEPLEIQSFSDLASPGESIDLPAKLKRCEFLKTYQCPDPSTSGQ